MTSVESNEGTQRMGIVQTVVSRTVNKRVNALSTPEKHQLKIARASLKLSCIGCKMLGGPNHAEAVGIIHELTGCFVNLDADCTCGGAQ